MDYNWMVTNTNYDWSNDMTAFQNGERQYVEHYNAYPHYCYKRFEEPMNFNDAKAKCEDEGATMLEPNWSSESWTVLKTIYDQFGEETSGYWIGMRKEGDQNS